MMYILSSSDKEKLEIKVFAMISELRNANNKMTNSVFKFANDLRDIEKDIYKEHGEYKIKIVVTEVPVYSTYKGMPQSKAM